MTSFFNHLVGWVEDVFHTNPDKVYPEDVLAQAKRLKRRWHATEAEAKSTLDPEERAILEQHSNHYKESYSEVMRHYAALLIEAEERTRKPVDNKQKGD